MQIKWISSIKFIVSKTKCSSPSLHSFKKPFHWNCCLSKCDYKDRKKHDMLKLIFKSKIIQMCLHVNHFAAAKLKEITWIVGFHLACLDPMYIIFGFNVYAIPATHSIYKGVGYTEIALKYVFIQHKEGPCLPHNTFALIFKDWIEFIKIFN